MDAESELKSKIAGLVCTIFILIAVAYGIGVISNGRSNANYQSSIITPIPSTSMESQLGSGTTGTTRSEITPDDTIKK